MAGWAICWPAARTTLGRPSEWIRDNDRDERLSHTQQGLIARLFLEAGPKVPPGSMWRYPEYFGKSAISRECRGLEGESVAAEVQSEWPGGYLHSNALGESNLECQGPSGEAKRSPPGEGKCPVTLSLSRLAPSASAWAAWRPS